MEDFLAAVGVLAISLALSLTLYYGAYRLGKWLHPMPGDEDCYR